MFFDKEGNRIALILPIKRKLRPLTTVAGVAATIALLYKLTDPIPPTPSYEIVGNRIVTEVDKYPATREFGTLKDCDWFYFHTEAQNPQGEKSINSIEVWDLDNSEGIKRLAHHSTYKVDSLSTTTDSIRTDTTKPHRIVIRALTNNEVVEQQNLVVTPTCVYTYRILSFLKYNMLPYLEGHIRKIKP
jgi:hypothetical protein